VDGVTAAAYAEDLQGNIEALVERLKLKRYRAKLVRRKYIPKENGKERPLGIPALEDKLVQVACAKLLMAIYEQDFLSCSYGYRPGRGTMGAVKDLTFDLQYGCYGYVVEADIKGFYDHMDHECHGGAGRARARSSQTIGNSMLPFRNRMQQTARRLTGQCGGLEGRAQAA